MMVTMVSVLNDDDDDDHDDKLYSEIKCTHKQ